MREANRLKLLGFLLAWVVAFVSCVAFAQPQMTRGGALKKRQYQTYSAMTYYLDPAGSDSNACTSSGTSACLTLQAVLDKIPPVIRHSITINVAAGTYTGDATFYGHSFSGTTSTAAQVVIQGAALGDVTPTTGTATGTITSLTTTNTPLPTINDSGQAWTTNDLRGYFLVITSGAQNGARLPIVANTATTITTLPWSTAPTAGVTYAIQKPTSIFSGTLGVFALTGFGAFRVFSVDFTSSSVTSGVSAREVATSVALQLSTARVIKTSGTGTAVSSASGNAWGGGGSQTSTAAPFVAMSNGTGFAYVATGIQAATFQGQFYGYTAGTSAVSWAYVGGAGLTSGRVVGEAATGGGSVINVIGLSGWSNAGQTNGTLAAICPSATGVGIELIGSSFALYNVEVTNCATGLHLGSSFPNTYATVPSSANITTTLRCTNTTTCASVEEGGRLNIRAAPTLTGVTNAYSIDGVAYTEAFFAALSPLRIIGVADSRLTRY